jgi:hypothetical protein
MSQLPNLRTLARGFSVTPPTACTPPSLYALIRLPEPRRRLAQGLAGRELAGRPSADRARVVVGQRRTPQCFLLILEHVLCANELPVIAQAFVELLGWVEQDGCQDRLQTVHGPQDDLHYRRGGGLDLLDAELVRAV